MKARDLLIGDHFGRPQDIKIYERLPGDIEKINGADYIPVRVLVPLENVANGCIEAEGEVFIHRQSPVGLTSLRT